MQTRDERFQPCPAFREGTLPQVFLALHQEVVGAEMGGKFGQQLGVDALAIEPLLQDVETLHPAVAHDQQLAIDRSRQSQGFNQVGEAPRNVLPSAGIEARYDLAVLVNTGHGLDANAVPFPLAQEFAGIERIELAVFHGMGEHSRPEGCRIAVRRRLAAAFQPGEQLDIGRPQAGPEQLDFVRVLVADCRGRGFCEPGRHADPQPTGDQLEQCPPAGLIELVEPARKLCR